MGQAGEGWALVKGQVSHIKLTAASSKIFKIFFQLTRKQLFLVPLALEDTPVAEESDS